MLDYRKAWRLKFEQDRLRMHFAVRRLLPEHRASHCQAWRRLMPEFEGELKTCGSVWVCPICSEAIAGRERHRLRPTARDFIDRGGVALFVTMSFAHSSKDELSVLLERHALARAYMQQSYAYKSLMADAGRVGSVRGLEVTYGEQGWHLHTHDLVFLERPFKGKGRIQGVTARTFEAKYRKVWRTHAKRAELRTSEHSFHMQPVDSSGFDGRWDVVAELINFHKKVAQPPSRSPMQILHAFMKGDEAAGKLFKTYAVAIHGSNRVVWSPRLAECLAKCSDTYVHSV